MAAAMIATIAGRIHRTATYCANRQLPSSPFSIAQTPGCVHCLTFVDHPLRLLEFQTPGAHTPQSVLVGKPPEDNDARNDKPDPLCGGKQNPSFAGATGRPVDRQDSHHFEAKKNPEKRTHLGQTEFVFPCQGLGRP